jgi:hypothetical protein
MVFPVGLCFPAEGEAEATVQHPHFTPTTSLVNRDFISILGAL